MTSALAIVAIVLSLSTSPAVIPNDQWSHKVPLILPLMSEPSIVELCLPQAVYSISGPSLSDLRVTDQEGREVPYMVEHSRSRLKPKRVEFSLSIFNRIYEPGKWSSADLDFGSRKSEPRNRLRIITRGTDFRRKVRLEASDDGQTWAMVYEGARLLHVPGKDRKKAFVRDIVSFEPNNQRYMRVTVFNSEGNPEIVDIQDVRAFHLEEARVEDSAIPLLTTISPDSMTIKQLKNNITEIVMDFGQKGLPQKMLYLDFAQKNFFRNYSLYGRNGKTRVITTRMEDNRVREKKNEEPWRHLISGVLYRYSDDRNRDQPLSISLRGSRYRYLRLLVRNRNNTPVTPMNPSITVYTHILSFSAKPYCQYTLWLGNADAKTPGYDLEHFIDRMRARGAIVAKTGTVVKNEDYTPSVIVVPWTERYHFLLWIVMLVVLGGLAYLVIRQMKLLSLKEETVDDDQ